MAMYRQKKAMKVEGWKPPVVYVDSVPHPSHVLRQRKDKVPRVTSVPRDRVK